MYKFLYDLIFLLFYTYTFKLKKYDVTFVLLLNKSKTFCTIKNRITYKKKKIALSAALIFVALFRMPTEAPPIEVPPGVPSAPEIHRPASQHFHQHAPTIHQILSKILI